MYVPIVPFESSYSNNSNTVINKTIVYSDSVLNLKELGENLKVTSINDVKDYDLEKCLKLIFESNKNIIFNTIQYSKEKNKVYFYTNREIDTSNWDENKTFKYKSISNEAEILEEVKNVLMNEKTSNLNVCSINNVFDVIYKYENEYKKMIDKYKTRINNRLINIYGKSAFCCIHDFEYDKNILSISFRKYSFDDDYDRVKYSKNNNDLYIVESSTCLYKNDYINNFCDIISELYDEIIKYEFITKYYFGIILANSNFYLDISRYGLTISDSKPIPNFELRKKTYNNNFAYKCNSSLVINAIKGNEEELFKRIYINIKDCPKWMRKELTIIRYNELKSEEEKERKIQEQKELEEFERKLNESKNQKRLELKRKIFSWLKK